MVLYVIEIITSHEYSSHCY